MATKVLETSIAGAFVIEPQIFVDDRGFFVESYRRSWIPNSREMIQSNRSNKLAGSLAGFHYHLHQADYWYVPSGIARAILCDIRKGSPTEGSSFSIELSGDNNFGLYIPPGVAHGFSAQTNMILTYLVDNYYNEADELGVAWDDPVINANWGFKNPVLSKRDSNNLMLKDIDSKKLPVWPLRT